MSNRVARFLIIPSLLLACALAAGCGQSGRPASTAETRGSEATETPKTAPLPGQLAFEVSEGLGQYNGSGTIWLINTEGTLYGVRGTS